MKKLIIIISLLTIACNNAIEDPLEGISPNYIECKVDGITTSYDNISISKAFGFNSALISGVTESQQIVHLYIPSTTPQTINEDDTTGYSITYSRETATSYTYYNESSTYINTTTLTRENVPINLEFTITIDQFNNNPGGSISGSFSGTLFESTFGETLTITDGIFHIEIEEKIEL